MTFSMGKGTSCLVSYRRGVDWDSKFPSCQEGDDNSMWELEFSSRANPPQPDVTFYKCPGEKCNKLAPSSNIGFQRYDLDVKVRCRFCLHLYPAKAWDCSCGMPWHYCDMHKANYCNRALKGKRPTGDNGNNPLNNNPNKLGRCKETGTPTGRPQPDYQALLECDTRRAQVGTKRKVGDITLGNRSPTQPVPTVLGPILRARFPGIAKASRLG